MKHLLKNDYEKTVQTVGLQGLCEPEKETGLMICKNCRKRPPETEKNGIDREGNNRKWLHGYEKKLH